MILVVDFFPTQTGVCVWCVEGKSANPQPLTQTLGLVCPKCYRNSLSGTFTLGLIKQVHVKSREFYFRNACGSLISA